MDLPPHTTIGRYKRMLKTRLIPPWGKCVALGIEPLEIEQRLKAVKKEERARLPSVALLQAIAKRQPPPGLVHHSDLWCAVFLESTRRSCESGG
jgi:hypothetical protein